MERLLVKFIAPDPLSHNPEQKPFPLPGRTHRSALRLSIIGFPGALPLDIL
jgi:hypothetical protein